MALKLSIGAPRQWVAVEFDRRRVRVLGFHRSHSGCRFDLVTSSAARQPVDITDAAAVGEFVAEAVAELKLTGARAVMNVRRGEAVLRPLVLPPGTPDDELAGMVEFQVAKELPFATGEAVIDHIVADHYQGDDGSAAGGGRTVLAAAARTDVVEFYRQVASIAGLRLVRLGLRPQAIGRCIAECVKLAPGECVAVVNVTADETEIDLFIDGSLAFSRSVPIGMPDRAVWPDERQPAVAAAVREVMLSLQSFQAVHTAGDVDAVLISGDTGLEDDLVAALSRKVSGTCELFNPARALNLSTRSDASAYAALLGAALIDPSSPANTLDLLNPKRPVVPRDPNRDRVAIAGLIAMAVLAVAIGVGWWYLGGLAARKSSVVGRLSEAESVEALIQRDTDRIKAIEAWQNESVDWLGHWAQISTAFPPAKEAYIRNFATRDDGVITFTVRAKTRETIEQVQTTLGSLGGYRVHPAKLLPGGGEPLNLNLGYIYESQIEVQTDRTLAPDLTGPAPQRSEDDGSATMLSQRLRSPRSRGGRGGRR